MTEAFKHREAWLHAAAEEITGWFQEINVKVPPLRISCGWSKRAGKAIGWCWHTAAAQDKVNQIYVSPEIDKPVQALAVLVHEMVHASDDGASKHHGHFRKTALAMGLEGKMTATTAGDALKTRLTQLAAVLGEYPHSRIEPGQRIAKQGTRMIKLECPSCGYTARTSRKWLDVGFPTCPCGSEMESPE